MLWGVCVLVGIGYCLWHPVGHPDVCLFATGFISCAGGEGGVGSEGSGGGYGLEVGYLDRTRFFFGFGLCREVWPGETEVCLLGAEADDVAEGAGLGFVFLGLLCMREI